MSSPRVLHPIPPLCLWGTPNPPNALPFSGHQVSTGLGASSPTEAKQGSPLPGGGGWGVAWTSLCMLFGWWINLWDLPGIQVSWHCWSSYGVAIPFSSFNPSPNSSIGVPSLSPMVGCKHLHLSQSAAGRASQRTAMLGSCLQAEHSIVTVRIWWLPMGRIPS